MSGLRQQVVLAADDGSLGPLLRIADDRLPPGGAYGRHAHRAVDVVAVVLAGALRHEWAGGADPAAVHVAAGDVAVLRAGAGLEHDERAGDGGARVLQCYLRAADPSAAPAHEVHPRADGWVDLGRDDARLRVTRPATAGPVAVPGGLVVLAGADGARAEVLPTGGVVTAGPASTVLVWRLDTARPAWATG